MTSVWRGIESVWGWETVPAEWRRHMGEDFERVRGTLLTPTGRLSNYYPSSGICRCNLRVVQHAPDDIVGVSDVSFAIGAGVSGLLGPNGAGKSTTVKMMAGTRPR